VTQSPHEKNRMTQSLHEKNEVSIKKIFFTHSKAWHFCFL
jgi:hypothetical protein